MSINGIAFRTGWGTRMVLQVYENDKRRDATFDDLPEVYRLIGNGTLKENAKDGVAVK